MSKVIILTGNVNVTDVSFTKNDDVIIVAGPDSMISVALAKKLQESRVRYEILDNPSVASYAFLLGKLSDKEKITDIYTDNEELKNLFSVSAPKARTKKVKKAEPVAEKMKTEAAIPAAKKEPQKTVKAQKEKDAALEKVMNPPVTEAKSGPKEKPARKPRTKEGAASKSPYTTKNYTDVTENDVQKILKKHGYDLKYAAPIMEALKIASDVSLDLYVRTKVALIEENGEITKKLGELMKKELA